MIRLLLEDTSTKADYDDTFDYEDYSKIFSEDELDDFLYDLGQEYNVDDEKLYDELYDERLIDIDKMDWETGVPLSFHYDKDKIKSYMDNKYKKSVNKPNISYADIMHNRVHITIDGKDYFYKSSKYSNNELVDKINNLKPKMGGRILQWIKNHAEEAEPDYNDYDTLERDEYNL